VDPHHAHATIGLMIGEATAWGQGYASEAIATISAYGFTQLKLRKLTAGCYASNQGSARAFIKAGYVLEGRQQAQWVCGEGEEDNLLLGLTRRAWLQSAQGTA
jgi:RimJ/RimL family protein N-acetyltransferase